MWTFIKFRCAALAYSVTYHQISEFITSFNHLFDDHISFTLVPRISPILSKTIDHHQEKTHDFPNPFSFGGASSYVFTNGSFFTGADPILGKSTSSTCTTTSGGGSQGALSPLAMVRGGFWKSTAFFFSHPFLVLFVFFKAQSRKD